MFFNPACVVQAVHLVLFVFSSTNNPEENTFQNFLCGLYLASARTVQNPEQKRKPVPGEAMLEKGAGNAGGKGMDALPLIPCYICSSLWGGTAPLLPGAFTNSEIGHSGFI